MTDLELYSEKIFEDIKHYTEDGMEFSGMPENCKAYQDIKNGGIF